METALQLVDRLVARWTAEGTPSLPPPEAAALDQLEERHFIRLPADLRTHFTRTGGLPAYDLDSEGISWWAADRIVPLGDTWPKLRDALGFFAFADMLVGCTLYAIQLWTTSRWPYGTVLECSGERHLVRAASWSEFLQLRLDDPDRITLWRQDQSDSRPAR
jgi:hypothetical protein